MIQTVQLIKNLIDKLGGVQATGEQPVTKKHHSDFLKLKKHLNWSTFVDYRRFSRTQNVDENVYLDLLWNFNLFLNSFFIFL